MQLGTLSCPAAGRVGEYQKSGVMNSLKKGGESEFVFKTEEDF
jgi:hypothetical protein